MTEHLKEDVDYMTWALRSGIAGLIAALLALVIWLATAKDSAILQSIQELKASQEKWQLETRRSDERVTEAVNQLCNRVAGVETRVGNLEIFIQMPFIQRSKLFESYRLNGSSATKKEK